MQNDSQTRTEIRDWMGAIGRRAWLVILIPLVAAFGAAVNEIAAPQAYRSIATVTLLDVPTTGPVTSAVVQAVADYQAAATAVGVLDAAAEQAGVEKDQVDIVTRRVAQGGVVLVVGVGGDAEATHDMVDAVARQAMRSPVLVRVAVLEAQVAAQQRLVDDANAAFIQAMEERDIALNETIVEKAEKRWSDARDALNAAQEDGLPAELAAAEQDLSRATDLLADIRFLAGLDATRRAREEALGVTQIQLSQAQGERDAIVELAIPVTQGDQLGRITPALRSALGAAVFGLLLALGIVAFLEVGTTRRRQRRQTRTRVMEKQRQGARSEPAARRS